MCWWLLLACPWLLSLLLLLLLLLWTFDMTDGARPSQMNVVVAASMPLLIAVAAAAAAGPVRVAIVRGKLWLLVSLLVVVSVVFQYYCPAL